MTQDAAQMDEWEARMQLTATAVLRAHVEGRRADIHRLLAGTPVVDQAAVFMGVVALASSFLGSSAVAAGVSPGELLDEVTRVLVDQATAGR